MSKLKIDITITTLCTACGAETDTGMVEAKNTGHPFERDYPEGRTDQRVFVYVCRKCYVHVNDEDALRAALAKLTSAP